MEVLEQGSLESLNVSDASGEQRVSFAERSKLLMIMIAKTMGSKRRCVVIAGCGCMGGNLAIGKLMKFFFVR